MNTFLPYPNFIGSAKVLDVRRLGKQRVENLQIMQTLLKKRVVGTARFEPTGEFQMAYYDKDRQRIPLNQLDVFDSWTEESVPVTRIVETSMDGWYIEDYEPGSWRNHPAVLMWKGYEHILMEYQNVICEEWISRTFKDSCMVRTRFLYSQCTPIPAGDVPEWFGDEAFHLSHQSNLLRKHPEYYSQFFPGVPNNLPYVWPVTA